jgi:hypothetical protein
MPDRPYYPVETARTFNRLPRQRCERCKFSFHGEPGLCDVCKQQIAVKHCGSDTAPDAVRREGP